MADTTPTLTSTSLTAGADAAWAPPQPVGLDEARALARDRFKSRLQAGEQVGACACHDDAAETSASTISTKTEPATNVAGVRFRDSGRTYFFDPAGIALGVGDWVVVETGRGLEAGRVVIAPSQVRLSMLQGDVMPVRRRLDEDDVRQVEGLKGKAAGAVRTFSAHLRSRHLGLKPIAADYSFDESFLTLSFAVGERERAPDAGTMRAIVREMENAFRCQVELRQVGPREEARLLGGLGRCGRTLCCSSWLPVFPEISSNMAKTQDLPLNPSKVSGVCGRLLCCLSYENEQYKQMKAVLPRLGETIQTPTGPGMVISLQILKELVTVRLAADQSIVVFPSVDLGLGVQPFVEEAMPPPMVVLEVAKVANIEADERSDVAPRRRRRRGRRGAGGADAP